MPRSVVLKRLVERAQPILLISRKVHRRFHLNPAEQIADATIADGLNTFPA